MQTSRRILFSGMLHAAVALLPHLEHLMDRIALIRVVRQCRSGLLERPCWQVVRANDTRNPDHSMRGLRQSQAKFSSFDRNVRIALRKCRGWCAVCVHNANSSPTAGESAFCSVGTGKVGECCCCFAELAHSVHCSRSLVLRSLRKFGPGVPSASPMPCDSRIPYALPIVRLVCRKDVIEAAVFADNEDHVLDWRFRHHFFWILRRRLCRTHCVLRQHRLAKHQSDH